MNKRQIKITLLTLVAAAIAGMAASVRADDSSAPATPSAPANQAASTKFHGAVTAVDTNAMTFTVDDQTYTVTSDSQISRNGKPATLSDVVVGDPVRGSYTTGTDGKLDVTKVRFGKGGKKKKSQDTDSSTPPAAPSQSQ
jgi:hypothetical protein